MKHLFLGLFCCLYLAKANAQTDALQSTVTYYAKDWSEKLSSYSKTEAQMVCVKTDKGVARATIFDPKTQKIIAVIRAKATPCFGEKGRTSMLLDSNFVLKIPDGDTYSFDAKTRILTTFDAKNRKKVTEEYRFTAKDTTMLQTIFYIKGNIHYQTVYDRITSYSNLLDNRPNEQNLEGCLTTDFFSNEKIATTYFPNGKTKEIVTKTLKKVGLNYRFKTRHTVYDSTGVRIAENVTGKELENKPNISLGFSRYGKINWIEDKQMGYKNHCIKSDYDDSTGVLTIRKFIYMDTLPYKIHYLSEKPDGFFRKETVYDEMQDIDIIASNTSLSYALFNMDKDENGKIKRINLLTQKQTWTNNACPIKPQYVIEGGYDGILPDGAWRIYFVDSVGKKTNLAVAANFKKGLPDGVWCALDAAKDTLASVTYHNGALVYDKFAGAYLFKKNYPKYLTDSLKNAQKARNLRNQPLIAQQHALYLKAIKMDMHTKTLWQCDTIATKINVSDSYGKGDYKRMVVIKAQFSPDSNSTVRLSYYFPDAPTVPMSVVRYHKKTKEIDSMAVLYNHNGKLLHRFDIQNNILLEGNRSNYIDNVYTYRSVGLPNDSVRITTTYTDETQKGIKTIRTDSLAYTPTLRKVLADKPAFGFYFKPKHFYFENNEISDIVTVNKYENYALCAMEYEQISPISVHQTTYYSPENKPLFTETSDNRRLIYDADGAKVINILDSDTKWTGINKRVDEYGIVYTEYYKNGKRDGTWTSAYTLGRSVSVYENDVLLSDMDYNVENKKTKEARTIAKNRLQTIHYNEKQDTIAITIDSIALKTGYYGIKTESHLQNGKYYAQDSMGKRYLLATWQKTGKNRFLLRSWYASGAPQIVYAYLKDESEISGLDLAREEISGLDAEKISNLTTQGILVQHENGKLYMQGIDSRNGVICEYDENGIITSEQIEANYSKVMRYPKADETATCHWESLPYQEGKIENGRRVGNWRGYFRNAKKQLQYQINYDAEGNIMGAVERFDTNGAHLETETYANGKRNGRTTKYKDNQITKVILYENDVIKASKNFDKNGKIYSQTTQNDSTEHIIEYYPNTQTAAHHMLKKNTDSDFKRDSVYNESGELVQIIEKKGDITTETNFVKGKISTNYAMKYYNLEKNQKDYLKTAVIDINNYGQLYTDFWGNEYQDKNTLLSRLTRFKDLKLPAATLSNFEKTQTTTNDDDDYDPRYDYDPNIVSYFNQPDPHQAYPYNLSFPNYHISDNFGQTIVLTPCKAERLIVSLAADSLAESSKFEPIEIHAPSYASCGNARSIGVAEAEFATLNTNKQIVAVVSAEAGITTTLRYPAALLHPANSREDAAFVFLINRFKMVKTFPNYYKHEKKFGNKTAQVQAFAKLEQQEYEKIFADNSQRNTQIYTLGNTNLDIIPTHSIILNDTPLIADENEYAPLYETDLGYMYFPHHQTATDNSLICDAFLQQKKFRTLCTSGFIRFAPAIPQYIDLDNILIDNQEINGSFSFYTNEIDVKSFAAQCKAQHIDLIFTEKDSSKALIIKDLSEKTRYTAHFRYRK